MAAAAVPAPKPQSGFVTFFKKLGQDLAKILPAVDAVEKAPAVQALESLAFGPAITNLIATWIDRATVVEAATAAAVGTAAASSGTNSLQKASIVINSMTPVAQQLRNSTRSLTAYSCGHGDRQQRRDCHRQRLQSPSSYGLV